MRTVSPAEAAGILAQLKPLQRHCKKAFGSNFVYASDEMYLLAGRPMPGTAFYDSFPQYANGVGISRAFLDEVAKLRRRKARRRDMPRITMVTGTLASGVLKELAVALRQQYLADAEVVEVADTFWGGNVGCAGLLMGEEVLEALRGRDCGEAVFLPPDSVDNQRRMLDDITLDQMSTELGSTVRSDALGPLQMAGLLAAG
jgi:NifB/MoaA-like Fe-S oxidoreductase